MEMFQFVVVVALHAILLLLVFGDRLYAHSNAVGRHFHEDVRMAVASLGRRLRGSTIDHRNRIWRCGVACGTLDAGCLRERDTFRWIYWIVCNCARRTYVHFIAVPAWARNDAKRKPKSWARDRTFLDETWKCSDIYMRIEQREWDHDDDDNDVDEGMMISARHGSQRCRCRCRCSCWGLLITKLASNLMRCRVLWVMSSLCLRRATHSLSVDVAVTKKTQPIETGNHFEWQGTFMWRAQYAFGLEVRRCHLIVCAWAAVAAAAARCAI